MDRIKAYDDRAMSKSTQRIGFAAGCFLTVLSVFSTIWYSVIVGLILLLAVIMGKETYITETGISVEYNFFICKHVICWDFREITNIHVEAMSGTNYQALYFLRGMMTKKLFFHSSEIDDISEIAQHRNPDIHIEK